MRAQFGFQHLERALLLPNLEQLHCALLIRCVASNLTDDAANEVHALVLDLRRNRDRSSVLQIAQREELPPPLGKSTGSQTRCTALTPLPGQFHGRQRSRAQLKPLPRSTGIVTTQRSTATPPQLRQPIQLTPWARHAQEARPCPRSLRQHGRYSCNVKGATGFSDLRERVSWRSVPPCGTRASQ